MLKKASSKIVYYVIKNTAKRNKRHRTEQRTKCLGARRGPLPVKFLADANKLDQRKTQVECYKDILLTGNGTKSLKMK